MDGSFQYCVDLILANDNTRIQRKYCRSSRREIESIVLDIVRFDYSNLTDEHCVLTIFSRVQELLHQTHPHNPIFHRTPNRVQYIVLFYIDIDLSNTPNADMRKPIRLYAHSNPRNYYNRIERTSDPLTRFALK